jgi:metal-responsive CopG/Arc/MetJ family transcriptional regulator
MDAIDISHYVDDYSYINEHSFLEDLVKTVQMTLDEELVHSVDVVVKKMRTTRSAFARDALRAALHRFKVAELERRHRKGYEIHPVNQSEFGVWEEEQAWGDE